MVKVLKNIWKVGKGKRKRLEDTIRDSNNGDIIFLYPGEYHFREGYKIENLEIKGIGTNSGDVIIHGFFIVHNESSLTLSNVTVHPPHQRNAFNIRDGSTVNLDRVIVHSELSGEYPTIWCQQSKLNIHASEVYFSEEVDSGVYLTEHSEATIERSILDALTTNQSSIQLHQTQIRVNLSLYESSILAGSGLIDFPARSQTVATINMSSGSRADFDLVNVDQNDITIYLDESALTIHETKISDRLFISVLDNEKSTVNIVGDADRIIILDNDKQEQQLTSMSNVVQVPESYDDHVENKKLNKSAQIVKTSDIQFVQKSGLDELKELYGLNDLKEQIMKFINTVKFNQSRKEQGLKTTPMTLHSLFMGNPGTGKTTVARILGRVLYETSVINTNTFIEVTRKDLVSEYIGQTAQKTQEILEKSKGGILFIDEAYALNSGSENDFGQEAIDTIITFMEDNREHTMIIFAGYTDEMNQFLKMNSGLQSRIPNRFYFDDYTPEEIAEIGYVNITKEDYFVNEQKYKDVIQRLYTQSVDRSNARWVRNINEKLIQIMANRVIESGEEDTQTIKAEDLEQLTGNQHVNKDEKVVELLNQLDNLIGLTEVKDYVHRLMKQVQVDRLLLKDGGSADKPSYHMIFVGNPGTGKTTVANIIAELFYYLDILPTPNVKVVDRSDLVGAYVGHTEKQTKEVIEQSLGGVLFIDEAYQLTNQSNNDFGKQAVETLLTYLENYRDKFIVILAGYTNEMEQFLETNPGLRSRIPLKITFPEYSSDEVATIVEKNVTKNWEVNVPLLRSIVKEIYVQLPTNEQANARWARNFTEKLVSNHKVWLSNHELPVEHLKKIHDDVIRDIRYEYVKTEIK